MASLPRLTVWLRWCWRSGSIPRQFSDCVSFLHAFANTTIKAVENTKNVHPPSEKFIFYHRNYYCPWNWAYSRFRSPMTRLFCCHCVHRRHSNQRACQAQLRACRQGLRCHTETQPRSAQRRGGTKQGAHKGTWRRGSFWSEFLSACAEQQFAIVFLLPESKWFGGKVGHKAIRSSTFEIGFHCQSVKTICAVLTHTHNYCTPLLLVLSVRLLFVEYRDRILCESCWTEWSGAEGVGAHMNWTRICFQKFTKPHNHPFFHVQIF